MNQLFLNTEKPTAKVTPKPYPTLTQGDKLRLTCNVNKATINVTWKKDGDPVKERAVIETQLDETTSYLTIAKVVEEDSGEYSCEARNRVGNMARSIVMIKVNRKLAVLQCRNNLKFNSSKSFDLTEPETFKHAICCFLFVCLFCLSLLLLLFFVCV